MYRRYIENAAESGAESGAESKSGRTAEKTHEKNLRINHRINSAGGAAGRIAAAAVSVITAFGLLTACGSGSSAGLAADSSAAAGTSAPAETEDAAPAPETADASAPATAPAGQEAPAAPEPSKAPDASAALSSPDAPKPIDPAGFQNTDKPPVPSDGSGLPERGFLTPEVGEDGIIDSSEWVGNFVASDGKSLAIFPDMGNRLDVTAVTYSEEGWREWDASAVISSENPMEASMRIGGDSKVLLKLQENGIYLDTSPAGGLFMEDEYLRQDEPTDASVNSPHDYSGGPTDYTTATDISAQEVEQFARNVRIRILHGDTDSLIFDACYPFYINGEEYADEDALFQALDAEDSILKDEKFLKAVRDDDASDMFANYQGIMLGESGNVWIGERLDEEGSSMGLSILSFNR